MTAPYSMDLRERALARKQAGETNREIAAALRIIPSRVSKWTKRKRETGSLAPAQIGGYKPCALSGESADWLRARSAAGPFTLRGLSAELAEQGIKTHPRAVWMFVHAEGLSFKKKLLPEEQTRPDVARERAHWKAHQGRIAPSRLVFIDETPAFAGQALGEDQHGAAARLGDKGTTAEGLCAPRPLEDPDFDRRAPP